MNNLFSRLNFWFVSGFVFLSLVGSLQAHYVPTYKSGCKFIKLIEDTAKSCGEDKGAEVLWYTVHYDQILANVPVIVDHVSGQIDSLLAHPASAASKELLGNLFMVQRVVCAIHAYQFDKGNFEVYYENWKNYYKKETGNDIDADPTDSEDEFYEDVAIFPDGAEDILVGSEETRFHMKRFLCRKIKHQLRTSLEKIEALTKSVAEPASKDASPEESDKDKSKDEHKDAASAKDS